MIQDENQLPTQKQTNTLITNATETYLDRQNPELRTQKKELLKGEYTFYKRASEYLFVISFFVFFTGSVLNILYHLEMRNFYLFVGANIGAMLFADLASGIVHWGADTWGTLDTPLFGKTFVRSFREHHLDPTAICRHDFVETNGDNMMLTVPSLIYFTFKVLPEGDDSAFFSMCFWCFSAFWVAMTNQIHSVAHEYKPSAFSKFLMRWGIILGTQHHGVHHKPPFADNYCITNGWLNPILNKIKFWRILEYIITKLTGEIPRDDDYKWTGLKDEIPDIVREYIETLQDKKGTSPTD
eukprot:TRINITY_DN1628_c0_g1_i1.p1 TRINITY_DN1628_c0_g1~~TRINITY_DN1628_c0_g1_i1.p1  ORF type:complete len:307 (-),score=51.81 TRINITY_DN1628_c0_g1_i1:274-1164(-)